MPKGKTKKFIDKKNSVTFHLVHRSQKDPLIADETAPQKVLVEAGETQAIKHEKNSISTTKNRKEEQQKYGIFFDDEYNYLQHLKNVQTFSTEWEQVEVINKDKNYSADEKFKINLPSSVFESCVEEKVGLLNKAAPISGLQLDIDPDIAAALDDDFDFDNPDNELEDNFIELANIECNNDKFETSSCDERSDVHSSCTDEHHNIEDDTDSLVSSQHSFRDVEVKSRFTDYSMSSSIIKRNGQLTFLDNKFEKIYEDYDENEIGALDNEEIEGHIESNSNVLLQYVEDYENHQKQEIKNIDELMQNKMKIADQEDYSSNESEDSIHLEHVIVEMRGTKKSNCESILSNYTNIYNHPKLISESKGISKIEIVPETGMPKSFLNGVNQKKLTKQKLAQFESMNTISDTCKTCTVSNMTKSVINPLNTRPKNETAEQRKERKKAIKNCKKERREERKANIQIFKEEKKRQEKVFINDKRNVQGNRIIYDK